jgi:6-phosphogluconolactonase/glucosamine-6-phosphate isomerase/deaminase
MKLHSYQDSSALTDALTSRIIETAQKHISEQGQFSIAIPGGSTATAVSQALPEQASHYFAGDDHALTDFWQHWLVFLSDENFVEMDSTLCHYRALAENWLAQVDIPLNHVFPMVTDIDDISICVEDYRKSMADYLNLNANGIPQLDLVLLELDAQGNLPALPADSTALSPNAQSVESVVDHNNTQRITLSLPTLTAARERIIIAADLSSTEALRSINTRASASPLALLCQAKTCECYADQSIGPEPVGI